MLKIEAGGGAGLKIGILLGDDIGHEVVPECVKVMKAAAARAGLDIEWHELPIGKHGHEQHGDTLPAITETALWKLDGWIMGPIGHAAYPRNDPTWVMPAVRKKFELFAAVRPSRSYPEHQLDPQRRRYRLRARTHRGHALFGNGGGGRGGIPAERRHHHRACASSRARASNRVAREAFEIARTRPRKKVTAAHKEPVYRLACGMFAEECRKVAQRISGRDTSKRP